MRYSPLSAYDLKMMPYFFYHQLLACNYYGQFYDSTSPNKADILYQAKFATKLIKWFEHNVEDLSGELCKIK